MIYRYKVRRSWTDVLESNRQRIEDAVTVVEKDKFVVPRLERILIPFQLVELSDIRVVIVGQNPYDASPNMANGLAFSLDAGTSSTIDAIFKEVSRCYKKCPVNPTLLGWVGQGVFLLNCMLTITLKGHKSTVNHALEWHFFVRHLVNYISKHSNAVFMLWGRKAHDLSRYIKASSDSVIQDPFPLDRTEFANCNTFIKCDNAMRRKGLNPINWTI